MYSKHGIKLSSQHELLSQLNFWILNVIPGRRELLYFTSTFYLHRPILQREIGRQTFMEGLKWSHDNKTIS